MGLPEFGCINFSPAICIMGSKSVHDEVDGFLLLVPMEITRLDIKGTIKAPHVEANTRFDIAQAIVMVPKGHLLVACSPLFWD